MDQIKIGEFLKELRKQKKLTQQEAADALFVSQKTISRWETGEGIPDISIIQDVAKFYDVTVDEILTGVKKEENTISNYTKEINKEKNNKKLNTYFFVSLGIMLFFLILGIIFYFTLTPNVLIVVCPISIAIGIALYVFGYIDAKDKIDDSDKAKVRKKNLLFSDIVFVYVIIYLILFLGGYNIW